MQEDMQEHIGAGRPRSRKDRPRIMDAKISMPYEMYALVLEYSHENGVPVSWLGRKLFADFLRSVGKME